MYKDYLGKDIPKLGFGLMRLPEKDGETDLEKVKEMVDYFFEQGYTYFDTAYVYLGGKSEVMLKEAVVKRYPRESFQAATKLPLHLFEDREGMQKLFDESCERAGLDYYDFYLLHAIGAESYEKTQKLGAWDFIMDMKKQGRVKHIGFSFHDTADVLRKILQEHPETEFVQLQINYADWESDSIQSRKCYEVASEFGVPVIIMEPVKGGSLAAMTPEIQGILKEADPDVSIASWALRYAASLDGLITVLSGMSDEEQMKDNCKTLKDFKKLSDGERETIQKVVDILDNTPTIPCTSCKYCVDDCPMNINIPSILGNVNSYTLYNNLQGAKENYGFSVKDRGMASDCMSCGACESHCPQHIEIVKELAGAAKLFE